MPGTYEVVVDALVSMANIDRGQISLDSHIFEDLGLDSLDFLDVTFEIDSAIGMKLPIEDWMAEAKESPASGDLFVLRNFVERIEGLRAPA